MKKIRNQIKKRAKEIIALLCFTSMLTSALPVYAIGAAAEESFDLTPIDADQVTMQTVYDSPASDWKSQTLPLGNGYLGASVYGGIESEEILINEHTLWSGGPGANVNYDGGISDNTTAEEKQEALRKAREELARVMSEFSAGYTPGIGSSNTQNYPTLSSQLMNYINTLKGERDNFGSYQELGRIRIDDVIGNPMLEAYATNCYYTDVSSLFDGIKSGDAKTAKWFSPDGWPTWLDYSVDKYPLDIVVHYLNPEPLKTYVMTTSYGNIQYNRSPKTWTLYGSNDGEKWDTLHHVEDADFTADWESKSFELPEEVSYCYYKWTIEANEGGWGTQLVELELLSTDPYLVTAYGENCYNPNYSTGGNPIKNLFDNDVSTTWYSADGSPGGTKFEAPDSLILEYSKPYTIAGYFMTVPTHALNYGRMPTSWQLYGSNNGTEWEAIDGVVQGGFTQNGEKREFYLSSSVTYKYYKVEFLSITGHTNPAYPAGVHISDFGLIEKVIPHLVTAYGENCYNPNYSTGGNPIKNLFDNNVSTTWYSADGSPSGTKFEAPDSLIMQYNIPFTIDGYSMTVPTHALNYGRMPTSWQLYGSNNGTEWEAIDGVVEGGFTKNSEKKEFKLSEPVTYQYFKVEFLSITGHTNPAYPAGVHISDFSLREYSEVVDENAVTDYKRVLDIDNATAMVSYKIGNASYNREYFVSNPGNFIGARLTATGSKMTKLVRFATPQPNATITANGDTITITGWPSDHVAEEKLLFAAQIKVKTDGEIVTSGEFIQVKDATYIELYMTAGTNYQQCMDDSFDYFSDENPLEAVKARLAALEGKSYEELKATHVADYKELYDRVKINFGGITQPEKYTDDLLAGYASGTNTVEENRYLEALYYQFGRYLLISSSREGSLPANLQGIWGEGLSMQWGADYHANINLQMSYWLAEQTNLSECHTSLIDYTNSLVPRGEVVANTYHYNVNDPDADVRGWTAYHEINIWGNAAPSNWGTAFMFPTAAAWLSQHIWETYAFNLDKEFLEENYDTLKGAALFWVDNLVEDPRDGTLVSSPSYSPEHGTFSLGASSDQTIIWEVLNNALKAADVMGDDSAEIEEIKTALSKLYLPKIGVNGQYMEWKDEITMDVTGDNGHRHVNHLFSIYPGTLIIDDGSEKNNAYVEAIRKTLEVRGDSGESGCGWSLAWKMNMYARMHDAEKASNLVNKVLSTATYSNLFDRYKAGGLDLFVIDANFGTVAGMTEMLLQSQGEVIELLPALPSMWYGTAVTGLCARGNVEVDIKSDANGKLEKAILHAGSANDALSIKAEGLGGFIVVDSEGNKVAVSRGEDTITFAAEAGESYTLVKGTPVSGISLDKSEIKLEVGESAELVATIEPADATNDDIAWTSSNTKVATVVNGVVTAVGKGNATIIAASYDGSVSATCQVTVTWDTHVHTETIDKGYAPTCTEAGLSDGKHCDVCGEMLLAQEEIPATGHTEVVDPGRAPSCTEPGVSEGKHCGVCNEILVEQNEMQAIGHHWIDATCATPKTCERCGITDGEPHGQHDDVVEVIEPTCTEGGYTKITCQVCGDTVIKDEVEPLGHDFAEATTEAPKTCKVCGETEGDPLPKPEEPTEPEDPTTPEDPTVPEEPAKDHNECEGNWFTNILNAIINFFRRLIGLPEKCVCGEEI